MTATTSRKTETKTAKASTQKLRIHFADGNKGGVGKSFLARTLYQYCLDRKLPSNSRTRSRHHRYPVGILIGRNGSGGR
jgi:hypothetical protein